jgi:putative DNA primase/helicase
MKLPLGDFNEFEIPPMTTAKRDLIDLGLKPAERFVREWLRGYLPLPLQPCGVDQLYQAFKRWAWVSGERFPPSQEQFSKTVTKTVDLVARQTDLGVLLRLKPIKLDDPENGKKTARIWIPSGCGAPESMTEGAWAYDCTVSFRKPLAKFIELTGVSSNEE